MESSEDPRQSRFAHILQPIRDLSVNWSIDIANELEEYLDELESITFSFDDGATSLNFAEAALLIQGASCIYSKKVEFLYTLVYQALDFIEDKKRKEAGGGGKDGTSAADDDYFMEEQFLNLDDVVEEATGIDLDETTERLVTPRTRPPAALLAFTDQANQAGGEGDSERGGFKIATCSVHRSGALLLEDQDGHHLDEELRPRAPGEGTSTAIGGQGDDPPSTLAGDEDDAVPPPPDDDGPGPLRPPAPPPLPELNGQGVTRGADYGGGMGAAVDDDDLIPEGDYDPPPGGAEEEAGGAGRERRVAAAMPQPAAEEPFDPYAPLDPHDTGSLAVAPFRRGRSQMRARKAPAATPTAAAIGGLVPGEVPLPGASGVAFPEFAAAHAQRRREGRALSARARLQGHGGPATAPSAFASVGGEDAVDDEDDFDYGGGYDPVDDEGEEEELPMTLPAWGAIEDEIAAGHARNSAHEPWNGPGPNDHLAPGEMSYEDCVRKHVEAVVEAAAAAEVQTGLAGRVATWKKKIEPQLEEQDARVPFDIHDYGSRFLATFAKLPAIVAAVEKAGGGAGDIDDGVAADVAVPFEAVVGGTESYEASRTFAALLQLVNNGNVAIVKGATTGDEADNFDFTLVLESTHAKVLDFDEYRAPSAKEAEAGKGGAEEAPARAKGVLHPLQAQ